MIGKFPIPHYGVIKWQYFFGGSDGKFFDRYYKSEIDGQRVEKHASNRGSKYCIGEMSDDVTLYDSEDELIKALKNLIK